MDYRYLKAFTLTAEKESFTQAAEALGVAQSAVSRQVALFEESIGRQLLIRSPKKVALTPEGAELLAHIQKFEARNRHLVSKAERPIRIITMSGILEGFLASALSEMSELPDLVIETGNTDAIRQGLEDAKYDMAFSVENLESPLYSSMKLYRESFALISRESVDFDHLERYRWIVSEKGSQLKRLCRKAPKGLIRVRSIDMIGKLVWGGQGIAVVPKHLVPKGRRLKVYDLPQAKPSQVFLCVLNYTIVPDRLRRFYRELLEKSPS